MKLKELARKIILRINLLKRGYAGRIQTERDWSILLIFAGIIFLVSAAVNGMFFMRVYEGSPLSEKVNTNPPARETQEMVDELAGIEEIFDRRAAAQQAFIDTEYPFVDPARN